jgi:hypothetical protein
LLPSVQIFFAAFRESIRDEPHISSAPFILMSSNLPKLPHENPRENETQLCFLLFSFLARLL